MYYSYLNVKPNGYVEKPLMLLPGSYRFEIYDSFGDGMEGGGYSIWTGKELIERSGDFDEFDAVEFTVKSGGTKKEVVLEEFNALSPSPIVVAPSSLSERSLQESSQHKLHSIEIEVQYDEKPLETSWTLFRKLDTEIYTEPFNSSHGTMTHNELSNGASRLILKVNVVDLVSAKYWFRILDNNFDGICCVNGDGSYKITDITGGKNEVIHESDGQFYWYDLVEFELSF